MASRSETRTHNIYVIELDPAVLGEEKFVKANPNHKAGKACLYVGMTGRTPDERFKQHLAGYRAARYVKRYGKYLRRRMFERENPMTYKKAQRREREKARELREKGYAVWQN